MKHLDHLEEVGRGIAVAFVATVYGVGLANILLLPIAAKIQTRSGNSVQMRQLILTGVLAIAAGTNPRLVRLQLDAYCIGQRSSPERELSAIDSGKVAKTA